MKTVKTVYGENININDSMFFVTATDKFLSGWGCAECKIAKRVIICDTLKQARIIESGLKKIAKKDWFYNINICCNLPKYNNRTHKTSYTTYKNCPLFIENSDIK